MAEHTMTLSPTYAPDEHVDSGLINNMHRFADSKTTGANVAEHRREQVKRRADRLTALENTVTPGA